MFHSLTICAKFGPDLNSLIGREALETRYRALVMIADIDNWSITCTSGQHKWSAQVTWTTDHITALECRYYLSQSNICLAGSSHSWCDDVILYFKCHFQSDPPENCHLTVKKLPKTWHFFKCQKLSFSPQNLPLEGQIRTLALRISRPTC